MSSYRLRRRALLAGLGGAFGLRIMLENLEASAEGASSPPRFLMLYWPLGTVRQQYVPTGTGTTYTTSPILQPFETAGLRDDMIALYGLSMNGIKAGNSGGHEGGTVMASTGADIPGTRRNGGEWDDAIAGGPSFDQIFLRNVESLQQGTLGHATAIGDARVDSHETSSVCLCYSHATREVGSDRPVEGGTIREHTPILPTVSPNTLYGSLFASFMPGGDPAAATRAVKLKQSVLDSALRELAHIRTFVPASEWEKLDAHTEAIRRVELELGDIPLSGCTVPAAPDAALQAKLGSQFVLDAKAMSEDASNVAAVGKASLAVIRAAFQCDIIRVAAFQWASAVDQAAFKGMYSTDPEGSYVHRRTSMNLLDSQVYNSELPPSGGTEAAIYDFVVNVQTWFNQQTADALVEFKGATDAFGGNLLDHTIVPFITAAAEPTGSRSPMPAMIFGGKALGMQGGQFQNFSPTRPHNDLWMTIAQAYLQTTDPVSALSDEVFVKTDVAPIAGLWAAPT